jgi:hypothetical protein
MRMSKRRVINGNVFIQTRTGGWRLVKNGYIRTRRGWRKLRRRSRIGSTAPLASPIIEPIIPEQPTRQQWSGKYDALRSGGE